MQLTPYLNFDGQCAEAFRLYQQVLGGELHIMTHGDSPMAGEVAPEWRDRVLHARLVTDGAMLMASDIPPGTPHEPRGIYVSIGVDDEERADRIFAALSDGGRVIMPIAKTFWARRFAMFFDRYGIPWMVNCE